MPKYRSVITPFIISKDTLCATKTMHQFMTETGKTFTKAGFQAGQFFNV